MAILTSKQSSLIIGKGRVVVRRHKVTHAYFATRYSSVILLLLVVPGVRRQVVTSHRCEVRIWLLHFLALRRHLDIHPAALPVLIGIVLRAQSLILQVLLHGCTWRQLMQAFEVARELLCKSRSFLLGHVPLMEGFHFASLFLLFLTLNHAL